MPLGEFTSARNALVAQLKKAGRQAEANETKALVKPSVSAWVVNQLYWRHRGLFNRLIEAGDRLRHAQGARAAGKSAREPTNARRETVTALAKIAEGLLLGGNYNANRDMLRRVTSTLEALSSYGSLPGAPPAGRLTDDVDPPGFEALTGLVAGGATRRAPEPTARTASPRGARSKNGTPEDRATRARRADDEQKSVLAAAKAAVREAERTLSVARKQAERAAVQLDAAATRAKALEGQRAQIDKRLARVSEKAKAARENANEAAARANDATAALEGAERTLELARRRLQQTR